MFVSSASFAQYRPRISPSQVVPPAGSADEGMGQGGSQTPREGFAMPHHMMRIVVEAQMRAAFMNESDIDQRMAFDVQRTLSALDDLSDLRQLSSISVRI